MSSSQASTASGVLYINVDEVTDRAMFCRSQIEKIPIDGTWSCTFDPVGMKGGFNTVYRLFFSDGPIWVIKIPIAAARNDWTDERADHMISVARLVTWIRRNTDVPVPRLYSCQATEDSALGYPYLMEEYIQGVTAASLFAKSEKEPNNDALGQCQAQIVHDVAKAMVDLGRFCFKGTGMPTIKDKTLMCAPMEPAFTNRQEYEDPFADTHSYLMDSFDYEQPDPPDFHTAILHTMMDWAAGMEDVISTRLFHPDLHAGNIIVDEQTGSVKAILDWDFTQALPTSMGFFSYPKFLAGDWQMDPPSAPPNAGGNKAEKPHHTVHEAPQHEAYDYFRCIWRRCVKGFRLQLHQDPDQQFTDLDLHQITASIPRTYQTGLSQLECWSTRLLKDTAEDPHHLRQDVAGMLDTIWRMERMARSAKQHPPRLPPLHVFQRQFERGTETAATMRLVLSWWKKLFYLPGKDFARSKELLRPSAQTTAIRRELAKQSEQDFGQRWADFVRGDGGSYEEFAGDWAAEGGAGRQLIRAEDGGERQVEDMGERLVDGSSRKRKAEDTAEDVAAEMACAPRAFKKPCRLQR